MFFYIDIVGREEPSFDVQLILEYNFNHYYYKWKLIVIQNQEQDHLNQLIEKHRALSQRDRAPSQISMKAFSMRKESKIMM